MILWIISSTNGFAMGELERRRCPWDTDVSERADHGGSALDLQAKQECGALQGEPRATKRSRIAERMVCFHKGFSDRAE